MGLKEKLQDKFIYFDTNIFIYLFEGNDILSKQMEIVKRLIQARKINIFSSEIVYTEILPPVIKNQNQEILQKLMDFLDEKEAFCLIPMKKDICINAGSLRAKTGMKTPDALHVATALHTHCDIFLTNDQSIETPHSLEKILISDN